MKQEVASLHSCGRCLLVEMGAPFKLDRGRGHTRSEASTGAVQISVITNVGLDDVRHGVSILPGSHSAQEWNGIRIGGAVTGRGAGLGVLWDHH